MENQVKYDINTNTLNTDIIVKLNEESKNNSIIFLYSDNTEQDANNKKYLLEEKWFFSDKENTIKQNYKKRIIDMIKDSEIEWGCTSDFDRYVIKNKSNKNLINNINEIFIDNIENVDIVIKIFRAFSYLKYEETYPNAQTMCLASLSIDNDEIKEAAIQLFESWRNKKALELLKKINITEKWLRSYADQVIAEIEEELVNE